MKVLETTMAALGEEGSVTCEVMVGGAISNKKGDQYHIIIISSHHDIIINIIIISLLLLSSPHLNPHPHNPQSSSSYYIGVNTPSIVLPISPLTPKDRK